MTADNVKALVITGFGLNCEKETSAAFEMCGAKAYQVHLNDLLAGKDNINNYHILAFIGGFSFGDHIGSGTVFANKVKFKLKEDLAKFIDSGKLVIGICNGFQTLTRLGLAPALFGKQFEQQVALAHNDCGVFRDDWINMVANVASKCVFTKGPADVLGLPLGTLEVGRPADITIIDTETEFTVDPSTFKSKSRNTPYGGYKAKGRAAGTMVGGTFVHRLF